MGLGYSLLNQMECNSKSIYLFFLGGSVLDSVSKGSSLLLAGELLSFAGELHAGDFEKTLLAGALLKRPIHWRPRLYEPPSKVSSLVLPPIDSLRHP